jgi:hypothetical protein
MNKKLRHLLFWMIVAWWAPFNAQTINLSTGWNGGMVAPGTPDDTWTVIRPNQIVEVIPRATSLGAWAESGTSRWISPNIANAAPFGPTAALAGVYTYIARFTLEAGNEITCARLDIDAIGADNRILAMQINGNPYPLTLPNGNHFNPLTNQNVMLVIDPAHLNQGINTLSFTIQNQTLVTGFNFSGNIIVDSVNILPDVAGPATICEGNPLTFSGSLATGSDPSTHYQWKIIECDAAGNIVLGGFNWDFWYVGVPSQYTFPSSLNLVCDKYYMVVLAAVRQSDCPNWAQDTHVFRYVCKPPVNAGEDKTICTIGECVTIGTNTTAQGITYIWWSANGTAFGAGSTISVCPEVTTTYTVTATNNLTGCTSTDQVTVTVAPNDPSFELYVTHFGNYATVTATTNGTNANTPGFGQYWSVEVITSGQTYTIQNPSVWWPHTTVFNFRGFKNYPISYPLSGSTTTLSPLPAIGRFAANHIYRITRGTWSNDCGWKAESRELRIGKDGVYHIKSSMPVKERPTEVAQEATDDIWKISPNPSNGIFNISTGSEIRERTTVEVFDLSGRKIESKVIEAGTTLLPIDISGNDKGTYILNITTGGTDTIKKLIVLQ